MKDFTFLSYPLWVSLKFLTKTIQSLLLTLQELEALELEWDSYFQRQNIVYKSQKTVSRYFNVRSNELKEKVLQQLKELSRYRKFFLFVSKSKHEEFPSNPRLDIFMQENWELELEEFGQLLVRICLNKEQDKDKGLDICLTKPKNLITTSNIYLSSSLNIFESRLQQRLDAFEEKFKSVSRNEISSNKDEKKVSGKFRKFSPLSNKQVSAERTGLIPRSIGRTVNRFLKELGPNGEKILVKEFRISRYQLWVSIKCFFIISVVPMVVSVSLTKTVFQPFVTYYWNETKTEIFLSSFQEEKAFKQLKKYEAELFFDSLLTEIDTPLLTSNSKTISLASEESFAIKSREKIEEIAQEQNQESINAIVNFFGDSVTVFSFLFLVRFLQAEIVISRTFLTEILYSLSDTTKSFLIILGTDLLVGFHSAKAWEIFIELILERFGLPNNEDFILLCVATVPVLLDTAFKYWIFRYLNKLSPSTVVTYHNMIE
jgi:hypothetical protein